MGKISGAKVMENSRFILRVMSFNIRTESARDFRHAWNLRKHLVIERIHAFDPDLLGLQECQDGEQAQFIKEQLPDYEFLGVRRGEDSRTGREMAPLLFRKEAFELLDSGHFWLSKTPERHGSKLRGAVFPRTVTWAELRPKDTADRALTFFNTHFDYIPLILPGAAQILRERMAEIAAERPAVLTGDFNTQAGGAVYRILTASDEEARQDAAGPVLTLADVSVDSRTTSGKQAGTIHKFGLINRPLIIDWILASNHFQVVDAAIDDFDDNGLYPSDHFPVMAVLNAQLETRSGE